MPYKVVKRIDDGYPTLCINQVSNFLGQTAKFGKKIYTMFDTVKDVDGEEKWYLNMRVVAISRDAVYEILLTMECRRDLELNGTYEEFMMGSKPLHGLVPWHEDLIPFFYPCLAEKSYVDVFEYHNFTPVDTIEEI